MLNRMITRVRNVGIPDSFWMVTTVPDEINESRSYAVLDEHRFLPILVESMYHQTPKRAHERAVQKMRDPVFCRMMWNAVTNSNNMMWNAETRKQAERDFGIIEPP